MSTWDCDKCTFVNESDSLTCVMCYQVRSATRELPYTWQWLAQVDWIPYDAPSNDQLEQAYQAKAEYVNLSKGWFASKKGEYSVKFTMKPEPQKKSTGTIAAAAAAVAATAASSGSRSGDDDDDEEDDDDDVDDNVSMSSKAAAPAPASASSAATSSAAPRMIPAFTQLNNHTHMIRKVRRLANDDDAMFICIPPSATERGDKCSICAEEWWENADDEVVETVASAAAAGTADTSMSPKKPTKSSSTGPAASSSSASAAKSTKKEYCNSLHVSDKWPDATLANVKLPKCAAGHGFHRECIAQWIKLHDHCPMCKIRL